MSPSSHMGAPDIGWAYRCRVKDRSAPRTGDPLTRRGDPFTPERCPPLSEGCPRSWDGTILHGRSVTASRGGAHPYHVMAVPQLGRLLERRDGSTAVRPPDARSVDSLPPRRALLVLPALHRRAASDRPRLERWRRFPQC